MNLFHDHAGQFATIKSKLYHAHAWFTSRLLWHGSGIIIGAVFFATSPVGAMIVENTIVVEARASYPILDRIAECESGNTHFDPQTGQVLTMGNSNKTVDIGRYQLNEHYWGSKATELGLDLFDEKDNEKMAQWIFANYGTEPWVHSKKCWNEIQRTLNGGATRPPKSEKFTPHLSGL